MSALDLIPDAESEPVTDEPAIWRNWMRAKLTAVFDCPDCDCEHECEAGEVTVDCAVFASRQEAIDDVAETRAEYPNWDECWDYLGAFPQGERP